MTQETATKVIDCPLIIAKRSGRHLCCIKDDPERDSECVLLTGDRCVVLGWIQVWHEAKVAEMTER